jgi:hypothetical protein
MRRILELCTATLVILLFPLSIRADDITGHDRILCTAVQATECYAEGTCTPGMPEDWNVPRFLEIDFAQQSLSTTEASGQRRSSPMKNIEREGERIFIQGVESSRAFSAVLDQDSGTASIAIALERHVLAIFAYCTPLLPAD